MRLRRLAVGIATLAALVAGAAAPAWAADDYLVVASPGPHRELTEPPGWVTLVFKTEASATYAAIVVHNSAGENVTTGALIVEGTNVTTQLIGGLPEGTYTVIYRTEDENGEPRGGAYQFSYGPGTWTDVDDQWIGEEEQPPEIDNPGPPASIEPTPTAEPTQTGEPATPSPSATATEQPGTTAEPTPAPSQPAEAPNLLPWLIGGAVVLVAVVVGVVAARRRTGGPGTPSTGGGQGTPPAGDDQGTPPAGGPQV